MRAVTFPTNFAASDAARCGVLDSCVPIGTDLFVFADLPLPGSTCLLLACSLMGASSFTLSAMPYNLDLQVWSRTWVPMWVRRDEIG